MKRLSILVIFVFAACGVWATMNVHQFRFAADAQETPKDSKGDAASKNTPPREVAAPANDRPYPVFFIDEVLTQLTAAADELIEKKIARNSADLKETLERTQFAMALPRVSNKELSPQELYRRASESVFLVAGMTKPDADDNDDWQTSFSTAFAVHEDGILSTSAHVFDHDDQDHAVIVWDVKGRIHPVVEIVAADREADTCLFRIGTKGLKPLPLGKDASPGTPIRVMGHPGDSFFFFSAGVVANYERDEKGLIWLNVTADFGQGSSGGPVMDISGNVVGQVSRTFTLYSADETSRRKGRRRMVRQADAADPGERPMELDHGEPKEAKKEPDPQMTFKACTPVSAIRALVK